MINVGFWKFSRLCSNNDVVDGNMDELNEESNESHESKSDGCCNRNLLELLPVRLGAPLDQPDRVLAELSEGLQLLSDLVHGLLDYQ